MLSIIVYFLAVVAVGIISAIICYVECMILEKITKDKKKSKKETIEYLAKLYEEGKINKDFR